MSSLSLCFISYYLIGGTDVVVVVVVVVYLIKPNQTDFTHKDLSTRSLFKMLPRLSPLFPDL